MDYEEKMRRCQEYIDALEEERKKIQVFHRELPLSMHLVSQAIENYRQQIAMESLFYGRSECEEQASGEGQPVLEEFLPLKPSSSSEEDKSKETHDKAGKKSEWLMSVPLWNQDPPHETEESSRKSSAGGGVEMKKAGGAFHPYHGEKKMSGTPTAATSSTAETGGRREEKEGESHRKARRCWSPELHRRFLDALKQLGGSHAATPKQIRELMKVDGLTNDEVKSHLQKYRLHTRRPNHAIQNSSSSNNQPHQFLLVGGIWVPPPDSSTMAQPSVGPRGNGVYALVPALPQMSSIPLQQGEKQTGIGPLHWDGRGSFEEGHVNSSSPTTSSSSHTTTTSPAF
ncbi:myb family transcription factor EFM-like protein isoform X2 [Cinnamomum micranthum f. kanehirae]|uniref:Myb family transcription factor EFM-like protein isoform X2 n=1 Tax=Cinnamomum micranthum f. kanehirae TaxID=337451 RepID=A0A443P437_9MAGN|nr:myb family transcription factor EFM-like protein isoform X2 [Cinnamomum micranthum f. kanehirae]